MSDDENTEIPKFLPEVLGNYSEGDKEFEKELIDSYKQSITEHLPKLKEALENNDLPGSILRSHDIKGSSSYIGAEAVRVVSEKMETLCKGSRIKEASEYLSKLCKETKIVFKLLDEYTGTPSEDVEEEEEEVKKEDEKKEEVKKEDKKEDNKKEEEKEVKDDNKVTENSTKETDTKKQTKD